MKFAYPEFLYALSAIAIPIIIHLFNFRKFKKLYFSNVEFLKEVQQETQSRSKLKHLLILASRILAITFLVFAFAQPFIPVDENTVKSQDHLTALYIDNSFSMESNGEDGSLLNEAKNKALEIVNAHRTTDRFVLLTNDFTAGNQRLLSNEEILDKIESIQISTSSRNISTIYSRLRDALNNADIAQKSCYITSDFQKSSTDISSIQADSSIQTFFIPVTSTTPNNLYVDSCWFGSPTHLLDQSEELFVKINNNSDVDLENIPLKLYINDKSITPASFNVEANDAAVVKLSYRNKKGGIQQGRIEIRDRPVTIDDNFYFSYEIAQNINVLAIGEEVTNERLNAVFNTDSIFNFIYFPVGQLDYSIIPKSDLVILSHINAVSSGLTNTLKKYLDAGGSLFVIPSETIDLNSYREFLSLIGTNYYLALDTNQTKVKGINTDHPIYKHVFDGKPSGNLNLPLIKNHFPLSASTTSFKNVVLSLRNGAPYLMEYKTGKGTVYLNTSSLKKSSGNYANHALFVPTLYNMALLSQKGFPLFFTIGENASLELDRTEKDLVYHIKNKALDVIPPIRNNNTSTSVFVASSIRDAGNYTLEGENIKVGLAFNYDRKESDLSCYSIEELSQALGVNQLNASLLNSSSGEIKGALSELNIGKKYWKYCIILALLFLAAEVILIKLFK